MPDRQAQGDTSASPIEFLWPDEFAYEIGHLGWLSCEGLDDPEQAAVIAERELADADLPASSLRLTPVLMREESEVEAKINGHEFPLWVECTERARNPVRFWKVTRA